MGLRKIFVAQHGLVCRFASGAGVVLSATSPAHSDTPSAATRKKDMTRRQRRMAMVISLIVGVTAIVVVATQVFEQNLMYFYSATELTTTPPSADSRIRFGGLVILLWAVAVVIKSLTGDEFVYLFLRFSSSILLYWIGYQGFYKYNVVRDRIYLRSSISNLVAQIHKRGRDYENSISIDYLSRLNERYEAWIHGYNKGKLLIVDVDNLDFVDNPEDLGSIINKIDAEIHGLF